MEGAEVQPSPGEAPPASPGAAGEAQSSWTLYIGNLQAPDEGELQAFVQQHAPAPPTNVKVMRDKATGMNAGFGFVTFADRAHAEATMEAMNGQVAWGRPLKLQWAQHRGGGGPGGESTPSFDVFVGDLARDIDEAKLREAFAHLGTVTRVVVMWDYPTGRNKGYGFVSFATQQEAEQAIATMHGAMVGSRPIRCGWGQRRAQQGGGHGGPQHAYGARGGGRGGFPGGQQQQPWGPGPRGGPQAGFPGAAAGFPPQGFHPMQQMMMGLQLGMDPQQLAAQHAQQAALAAQQGMGFPPHAAAVSPRAPGGAMGSHMANGVAMEQRPGAGGRGKGGRGGQGLKGGMQPPPPPPAEPPKLPAVDMQHPGSSVSLPALAESGAGGAGSGSCSVRVDNVDKTVQKAELFSAFAKFGSLEDCTIVRKGNPYHAIIRFATPQQAVEAAAGMSGFQLYGRRLRCAVEGASPRNDGAGAMPRPKSASDLPMPTRGDRSQAVSALAAKMRAVLQDRGERPLQSPRAPNLGPAEAAAAAAAASAAGAPGMPAGLEPPLEGIGGGYGAPARGPGPAQGGGAFGGGAFGFGGGGPRPHAHPQQQQQHGAAAASHQWMPPSHLRGDSSPMAPGSARQGGGAQHAKHPPASWGQQAQQHMLGAQHGLLMAQQAAAAQHAQQAQQQAMRSAAAAGGAAMMQGSMPPMAFAQGGVVLPPQLAMLNMMAQSVPGAPPAFTVPMMYGGQPGMVPPQVMQPAGFAALQQQALIQQLLLHQQAQQAQQAAAGEAAAPAASEPQEAVAYAVPAAPGSIGSAAESAPSTSGTPPPTSTTPPLPAPEPAAEAAPAAPES